jgi:hypothetical protein
MRSERLHNSRKNAIERLGEASVVAAAVVDEDLANH